MGNAEAPQLCLQRSRFVLLLSNCVHRRHGVLRGAHLHRPKFPLVILPAGAKEVLQTRPAQPRHAHPRKASLRVHGAVAEGRHLFLVAPVSPLSPGSWHLLLTCFSFRLPWDHPAGSSCKPTGCIDVSFVQGRAIAAAAPALPHPRSTLPAP